MRRLFVPRGALDSDIVFISGMEFHHLVNVIRVKVGDSVMLLDGEGKARMSVIESLGKKELSTRITGASSIPPNPPVNIVVAQALGKVDKFEQVIQHGTELGAAEFIPMRTSRTVVKLDSGDAKMERWRAIVKGAAEQSIRAQIPIVHDVQLFSQVIKSRSRMLLLDSGGEPLLRILSEHANMEECQWLLMAGPEGGFTPEEMGESLNSGGRVASLGPFILRTETAALAALSQMMGWSTFRKEDTGGIRI